MDSGIGFLGENFFKIICEDPDAYFERPFFRIVLHLRNAGMEIMKRRLRNGKRPTARQATGHE
jgi:hypothetical protein